MTEHDSAKVLEIYKMGIDSKNATFNTIVPTWQVWHQNHLTHTRLVYEFQNNVVGWVALLPVSSRIEYAGVAEISIYLHTQHLGKGIGYDLLTSAIHTAETNGIYSIYASIFPENKASIALHQKCGFRTIGYREKIAKLHYQWRDTIIFERRSNTLGID